MSDLAPTPWTDADVEPAWQAIEEAFASPAHPLDREVELALVDPARFLVVRDEEQVVATAGAFDLRMTLPDRTGVPVAGISWVSVLPTHRRRGVLRSLMARMLDDAHERGEAVAALYASEGAIYQRFGFGPASWHLALSVPRGPDLVREVPSGALRRIEPTAALLAPAYDAFAAVTPGACARDERWWTYRLHDPEHARKGASRVRCVVTDGGYALYTVKNEDEDRGAVTVVELVATTREAHERLWAYVLDLDLTATVHAQVPSDDPLLQLLAEPRAAAGKLVDALWVRPVDVGPALSSRCYAADVDVVLDVTDPVCAWNTGRWRLSGGLTGATCEPTTDAADLSLGVADLGAALLGGTALKVRPVVEHTPGALHAASLAFGPVGAGPWNPLTF